MGDDIARFLKAQLDDEAEAARAALQRDGWTAFTGPFGATYVNDDGLPVARVDSAEHEREIGVHIARQDPQATLDRVEALRFALAAHPAQDATAVADDTEYYQAPDRCEGCYEPFPCPTLRALASAYRRHPDFDPAWAPEGITAGAGGQS